MTCLASRATIPSYDVKRGSELSLLLLRGAKIRREGSSQRGLELRSSPLGLHSLGVVDFSFGLILMIGAQRRRDTSGWESKL